MLVSMLLKKSCCFSPILVKFIAAQWKTENLDLWLKKKIASIKGGNHFCDTLVVFLVLTVFLFFLF